MRLLGAILGLALWGLIWLEEGRRRERGIVLRERLAPYGYPGGHGARPGERWRQGAR